MIVRLQMTVMTVMLMAVAVGCITAVFCRGSAMFLLSTPPCNGDGVLIYRINVHYNPPSTPEGTETQRSQVLVSGHTGCHGRAENWTQSHPTSCLLYKFAYYGPWVSGKDGKRGWHPFVTNSSQLWVYYSAECAACSKLIVETALENYDLKGPQP